VSSPVESRPEPLAFTIRDWFFVVVGVAAAALTPGPFPGPWFLGWSLPLAVFLLAVQIALAPAFVVTLALLGRQFQYGRAAKPAERLALTLVGWQIASAVPNLDTTINDLHTAAGAAVPFDWTAWRWGCAGVTLLLVLPIAVVCRALRDGWRWLQSLGLVAAVALLFWAPLNVLNRACPWPAALVPAPPYTFDALVIRDAVSCLPNGLVFGIPAVATWISWRNKPRHWSWTEWVSAGSAIILTLLLGTLVAVDSLTNRPLMSTVWTAFVWAVWLVAVTGVCTLYVTRTTCLKSGCGSAGAE